jgi:putative protease
MEALMQSGAIVMGILIASSVPQKLFAKFVKKHKSIAQPKSISRKEIELLAPVGDFASLHAAIDAGADSIYFGVENLNMRNRSANNFAMNDIAIITELCSQAGVYSYLAVNTAIFDNDIALVTDVIQAAKAAGVDAIIASDLAVMQLANSIGLNVHLSTQLNIANTQALKFYAQFADVAVLARELDLGQVNKIFNEITEQKITGPSGKPVRIEMFCHGALCLASSGRCFMSLHLNNTSANRGDCYQTCRRSYTVRDNETDEELLVDNEFILSPKDLKTIHFLDEMLLAGVRVFKIEGRARSADYVSTVVGCYREALDALIVDQQAGIAKHTPEQIEDWNQRLDRVFNRGFWDGYYLGQKLGQRTAVYSSQATRTKVMLGKCVNYFNNIQVAEFILKGDDLSVGDEILIIGSTTGVYEAVIESLVVDGQTVQTAPKGSDVTFVTNELIRRGDKLFKLIAK